VQDAGRSVEVAPRSVHPVTQLDHPVEYVRLLDARVIDELGIVPPTGECG